MPAEFEPVSAGFELMAFFGSPRKHVLRLAYLNKVFKTKRQPQKSIAYQPNLPSSPAPRRNLSASSMTQMMFRSFQNETNPLLSSEAVILNQNHGAEESVNPIPIHESDSADSFLLVGNGSGRSL
ncbi:hypothetical protein AVEN_29628-1 [Araneus ventricosus]|uniref:Uncharacterized protein n=1 Tax=Araneus ventricosus TaxID=182803 RepID=A0A4Y2QI95_ARAVE|nr:hypothetical protein AVEN_29628-1 [Araneus ventricosus]